MRTDGAFARLILAALAFTWACAGHAGSLPLAMKTITAINRGADAGRGGVMHLDAGRGEGLAWIDGTQFSQGRIEIEVHGIDLQGRSFVGLAFHGGDDHRYDAVYLRPFNFNATDPVRRAHAVQYVSQPDFTWSVLRQRFPGKYEAALDPPPPADAWVRLALEIQGRELRVYVNDDATPVLHVELLNDRLAGRLGLWVGDSSEGWFRGLQIQPR